MTIDRNSAKSSGPFFSYNAVGAAVDLFPMLCIFHCIFTVGLLDTHHHTVDGDMVLLWMP